MIFNRISVAFGGGRKTKAPQISYQYDAVQFLVINGIVLPDYYTVEFCNEGDADTITMTGTSTGVQIPDQLLATGKDIIAYIILHGTDENAVETRYEVKIPVTPRPRRSDIQPTPAEQQQIDELVEALNDGVARAEGAADEAEGFAGDADGFQKDAEAWANGTRDGSPVPSTDPAYQNNAKYWEGLAEQCAESAGFAWFDIDDSDGHLYVYVSDDLEDGLEFEINENTGILEVTFL